MILTDVDGVLLDWFGGFKSYLLERGIQVEDVAEPDDWSMVGWVHHDNIPSLIAEFNASPEFGRLSAYPDALKKLRSLYHDGHPIVAITSCSDDPVTHEARRVNLEAEFGPIFEKLICLPLMKSKVGELAAYPLAANTYWIEDSLHGAQAGVDVGHHTILIERKYNKKHAVDPRVHRARDWNSIYSVIAYE